MSFSTWFGSGRSNIFFFSPSGHRRMHLLLQHLRLRYLHLIHHQTVYTGRDDCVRKVDPANCTA